MSSNEQGGQQSNPAPGAVKTGLPAAAPQTVGGGLSGSGLDPEEFTAAQVAADVQAGALPAPFPPRFDETLAEHTAQQERVLTAMLARPDAAVEEVKAFTIPLVQTVAGTYDGKRRELEDQREGGLLTRAGYDQFSSHLDRQLVEALDTIVFLPKLAQLAGRERELEELAAGEAPSAQEHHDAGDVSIEMQQLGPRYGLARAARVLHDAVHSGQFGLTRALLPYLQSLYETPGTPWHGSLELRGFIGRWQDAVKDWKGGLAEKRLTELARVRFELEELRKFAVEHRGNLRASGSMLNMTYSGSRDAPPPPYLGWAR